MATVSETLGHRAQLFQDLLMEVATGPNGIFVSWPRFDTRRPFQHEEAHAYVQQLIDDHWGPINRKPTAAEWLYGENTLWVEGWFLWSQMLRYEATGESEARVSARKCFRDLTYLFELSGEIEPGALGKPHGGRPSNQTVHDQSACPVMFYARFAETLATDEERRTAFEYLRAHGDFYLNRGWVMNSDGRAHNVVDPPRTSSMKSMAAVYQAYGATGDTRYRDAVGGQLQRLVDSGRLPWLKNPFAVSHNLYYWGLLCDYWTTTELANEFDWSRCIEEYGRAIPACLDDEGLVVFGDYDIEAGLHTPYFERWLSRADNDGEWIGPAPNRVDRLWLGSKNTYNRAFTSAALAAGLLLSRKHVSTENAHELAAKTLLRLDEDTVRWWWDDGGLPSELKGLRNICAPEVAAMWLVAYWMGRLQGAW